MKIRAAGKYFSYVAKYFPVMCASGAFPALPPVTDASKWLDRLDDLSKSGIAKHIRQLKQFRDDFHNAEAKAESVKDTLTCRALALSASHALTELESVRTWETSPALYLQVAFIGLEQAVDMPAQSRRTREKRFIKRLRAIPALLVHASKNIVTISPSDRALGQTMIRDCARYLAELGHSELAAKGKAPRFMNDCLAELREFDRFLATHPEAPEQDGPAFAHMAKRVLGTDKSANAVYDVAEAEYQQRLAALKELEPALGKPWPQALADYAGPEDDGAQPLDLVIREIHRLRSFIMESELGTVFTDSGLRINPQPAYLASTLRPIHYDAALGAWPDEASRCYISPQIFSGRGFRDDHNRLARMRREFPFMTARQTYPGRHLIDAQRRALDDAPLAQTITPLFMDGWLAMAENLLVELGYFTDTRSILVHHQRSLARAALAMIDAGLAQERLDQDQCLSILTTAAYSRDEALERVRAIRVTPASRISPVLGLHELTALRRQSGLGLADFCRKLFSHGQLPPDMLALVFGVK